MDPAAWSGASRVLPGNRRLTVRRRHAGSGRPVEAGRGPPPGTGFPNAGHGAEMQSLDILLVELGRSVGLPDLAFDDEDCCALAFDELAVVLSCRREERKLCLYSEVGNLVEPSPGILRELLEANALHRFTGDGAIGICPDEGGRAFIVVYSVLLDGDDLDLARLDRALEGFVDMAESWRGRVAAHARGAPAGEGDPSGGTAPGESPGIRV